MHTAILKATKTFMSYIETQQTVTITLNMSKLIVNVDASLVTKHERPHFENE